MFGSFGCRQCQQVIRPRRGKFHFDLATLVSTRQIASFVAQSPSPHFDGCPRSLSRLDNCQPNRSIWDPIGRRNPADQGCSSVRPQCLPCTPVSTWGYCPIRRPSYTFIPFQCWSISPTLRDQQHRKKIT